jgi:hypothetical protein
LDLGPALGTGFALAAKDLEVGLVATTLAIRVDPVFGLYGRATQLEALGENFDQGPVEAASLH